MKNAIRKVATVSSRIAPGNILQKKATGAVIRAFAESIGMVYFGHVNQRDDEHRLLRGVTVSNTHVDEHYSVGTYQRYDIALTVRRNAADKSRQLPTWTIVTIDLHSDYDIPWTIMTPRANTQLVASHHTQLTELPMTHSQTALQFNQTNTLFGTMTHALEVERLFSDIILHGLTSSFRDLSVEVVDNTVYVYLQTQTPTKRELERLVSNGVWLAQHLDYTAEKAKEELKKITPSIHTES